MNAQEFEINYAAVAKDFMALDSKHKAMVKRISEIINADPDEDLAAEVERYAKRLRAGRQDAIAAAVAEAVAKETERCANVEPGMDTSEVLGWDVMTPDERRMWKAGYSCAMDDFAAAIRNGSASK